MQLGFTSLDLSFVIDGVTYLGTTGFDPGAAQQSTDPSKVDSQNLKGILDQSGISKEELQSGIFENAEVRRFLVDYTNLPSSLDLDPPNHLELPVVYFGEIKQNSLGYEIQTKDELTRLDNNIGETTSKICRANLGNHRCLKNLNDFTHNLIVTAFIDRRIFEIDGGLPDKYFDQGRLQFTSGLNNNIHLDIAWHEQNKIILATPAPFTIAAGDSLTAVAGCAKTKLVCITKFDNFRNFVGEPDVPTTDLAVNTPTV